MQGLSIAATEAAGTMLQVSFILYGVAVSFETEDVVHDMHRKLI
jgi:hypothetical protein